MSRNRIQYDLKALSHVTSAREFLRVALDQNYQKRGRVNLADFSRRAGFFSRSFLSEYLAGQKGLSLDSFRRIRDTLKLPKPANELFNWLAFAEQPELAGLRREDFSKEIKEKKILLANADEMIRARLNDPKLVKSIEIHQVFAALGAIGVGAALEEIRSRTQLSDVTIGNCLSTLLNAKLIDRVGARYRVRSSQLDSLGLGTKSGLSDLVKTATMAIHKDRDRLLGDSRNFLFYSAISVDAKRSELFRARLKDVILEVLDEFQADEGEEVRQLFLCLRGP
jgi:hypothetical protein